MDGKSEQQGNGQNADLDGVLTNIVTQCTNDEAGGVFLFHDQEGRDPEAAKREKAANLVYDMLMTTLGDIGADAVREGKGEGANAQEYAQVARAVEPIALACRGLADNTIQLTRNTAEEHYQSQLGDGVYAYIAKDVVLGGKSFQRVGIFIRPKKYIRPMQPRADDERRQRKVLEIKQPRMVLEIVPRDMREGSISLRVDQEDLEHAMEITYDVDIRPDRNGPNIVDKLDFSQAGQREGHHFSSMYTVKDLKMGDFGDLLETFNTKFDSNAKSTQQQQTQ